MAGLRFLSTEAAAHAPALDRDGVVGNAQRMRHPVLHLAGVLCAGVDPPLVLLQREHVGDLTFEVEVFLATDFEAAFELVRRAPERGLRVAAAHLHGRQHVAFQRVRLVHVEHGGQFLDL
ncbi:hypothetical protein D9M68_752070 [compost metagenome]